MTALYLNRRTALLGLATSLIAGSQSTRAARADIALQNLYRARSIVTGRRQETLIPGLKLCLREVLVRVSGDPRLSGHPDVEKLAEQPEAPVAHIDYRDLYAFRPIKDEQGTRDRPYEITVEYDLSKIDAMLKSLGSKPWLADRPRLVVFLAVKHIGTSYVLDSTNEAGDLQREAFADAAWNFAMPVVIPGREIVAKAGLTVENLTETALSRLQEFTDKSVTSKAIRGSLIWNRQKLGWTAHWVMEHEDTVAGWGVEGVNFDAAFRNAVGGAAQILSGNGFPT